MTDPFHDIPEGVKAAADLLSIATLVGSLVSLLPAVAALPPAIAGTEGREYYVSDANATTRLATVAGGGSNFVKVFSNDCLVSSTHCASASRRVMPMREMILECWRSGQIGPAEMVALCREDPALETLLLATTAK